MTANLVGLRTVQFSTRFMLLSQQRSGKLRKHTLTGSHVGKQASPTNQVAPVEMQDVVERFTPSVAVNAAVDRRWVYPVPKELPQMVNTFDEMQVEGDIKPALVESAVSAAGRAEDKVILQNVYGDAKTGEQGGNTETFGTTLTTSGGNNVPVAHGASAATNLTVAKLKEIVRAIMAADVDLDAETIVGGLNASAHDSLLGELQVQNSQYSGQYVLQEGRIRHFMGIDFEIVNAVGTICLGTDDASQSSVGIPFWVPSGMYTGIWSEAETKITQRTDLVMDPWQIKTTAIKGATRLEKKKVIRCWCRQ